MAGWPKGLEPRASERTASRVAPAMTGATAARKSVSRSVKSRPARTRPAAPQHAPSARNITRSSSASPNGRQTLLNLALRFRSRSGRSDSRAISCLRCAKVAKVCGSLPEYSASASRGSYSLGIFASPPVMVLITSVSGSMFAQQVRSVPILSSIMRMASVCSSLTPSPEAASAAMSRQAR